MTDFHDIHRPKSACSIVLRLFGTFEAQIDGAPLPRMRSRKEEWLLVLLALSPSRDVSRSWLAQTLWPFPDYAEEHAGHYLRRSLMLLRRGLGSQAERLTSPTPRSLRLDLTNCYCDVLEFDAAIARGDRESLEEAIGLYRGPLLEDCTEHWAMPMRVSREDSYFAAVESLANTALVRGDAAYARTVLRLAAASAPLREPIHRRLMEAYAAERQTAEALQVYHDLRLRLRRDNNCEPDPETTSLYQSLRANLSQNRSAVSSAAPAEQPLHTEAATLPAEPAAAPGIVKIPRPLTPLVGRKDDIDQIVAHLSSSRLVTLTGLGGIGKTRLAIEAGRQAGSKMPDGVFFVDLSPLSDPSLVAQTVASVLEAIPATGSAEESLVAYLRDRSLLLILDNCEHLLAACADLAQRLLRDCPNLLILATSRESLHIPGELIWRVQGLTLPIINNGGNGRKRNASGGGDRSEEPQQLSDSVRLFGERAAIANPGFSLTPVNLQAISEICVRLDGMPLAIELAASALRAMPAPHLSRRLDDYFRLLADMPDAGPSRQKTLRAALDWSYTLLNRAEQSLLMRLSVFAGGWSIESAETVCAHPEGFADASITQFEVFGLLLRLVDKSLIIYEDRPDGNGRYRLLHTVRQFAMEKLLLSGAEQSVNRLLREWLLMLAEQGSAESNGPEQAQWLDRLESEHDNMRAALLWFGNNGGGEEGLRLATALSWFWRLRGYATEGRLHLATMLDKSGNSIPAKLRLNAICGLGDMALSQGDFPAATQLYRQGREGYRELGDQPGELSTLVALGGVANNLGDYALARSLFEEALALAEDRHEMADLHGNLGYVAREQGDYVASRAHLERAVHLSRELGDRLKAASHLGSLAHVVLKEQGASEALDLLQQTLAAYRTLGNRGGEAWTLASMGHINLAQDNTEAAFRLTQEALEINRDTGNSSGEAWNLCILGELRVRRREYGEAEILLYQAQAINRKAGAVASEAWTNYWLGRAAYGLGNIERARELYSQSLLRMKELGIQLGIAEVVKAIEEMSP